MYIKKAILLDQERTENKFCHVVAKEVDEGLTSWLSDNRGCFTLLNLLETNDKEWV